MKRNIIKSKKIFRSRKAPSGFTLVEVMVVLFILLSLAGVAVLSYQNIQQRAMRQQTEAYVKTLEQALELYQVSVGRFPTTAQGLDALLNCPADLPDQSKWDGPYIKENAATHDQWGNPFQYAYPGTHSRDRCDVWSLGPDGMDGTDDDIGNWKK